MKFSAHGKVTAYYEVNSGILHIYITGPVNEEFIAEYESALQPVRSTIKQSNWVSIVHINGDAIISSAASSMVKQSILGAVEQGLFATAVIFYTSSGKLIFEDFWGKLYSELGVKHAFFDNKDLAKKWLLSSRSKIKDNLN